MPTFGNAFCCINKDPPNIAQFTAIRGRNIPNEAYNEGAYFSTTISTSCTKEAITAINIINERKEKLGKLYELENILKESLLTGDFTSLDSYVKLDTISSFRYKKLKEYDFSNVKFYVAKRDFIDMNLKESINVLGE